MPSDAQRVLDFLYALVVELGDWPTWETVDDQLDRRLNISEPWQTVDLLDRRLLRAIGASEPPPQQQVGLALAGMAQCDAAAEDLRIFVDSVRLGAALARDAPPPPYEVSIRAAELARGGVHLPAAGRDDLVWRQRLFWDSAATLWTSANSNPVDRTWSYTLRRPALRRLRDVASIEALLRVVDPDGVAAAEALASGASPASQQQRALPISRPPRTESFECTDGRTYIVSLDAPLGAGGQGSVFRGISPDGEVVAIKRMPLPSWSTERWYREASYAEREEMIGRLLEGHELHHVLPMLNSALTSAALYIVYPMAVQSLEDFITSLHDPASTMPQRASEAATETRTIAIDLARGLVELHENGVLHRDVKPPNALLHENHWVWSDLGIARLIEAATADHTLRGWGTEEYMAPELSSGERATVKSDVYAFGCTIYAMLLGHPPFQGDDVPRQHREEPPPLDPITDDLLRWILGLMLAKRPGSRPTAAQVLQMLSEPAGGGSIEILRSITEAALARQTLRGAAESRREARQRAAADAIEQFEIIWGGFTRAVKDAFPAATSSQDSFGWRLNFDDRQIEVTLVEPAEPSDVVQLGYVSIGLPASKEKRGVANLVALAEAESLPRWRLLRMVRNDLHPARTPVPTSYADHLGAVSPTLLEEHLRERSARVVVAAVTTRVDVELTVAVLTELFGTQVTALDAHLNGAFED